MKIQRLDGKHGIDSDEAAQFEPSHLGLQTVSTNSAIVVFGTVRVTYWDFLPFS